MIHLTNSNQWPDEYLKNIVNCAKSAGFPQVELDVINDLIVKKHQLVMCYDDINPYRVLGFAIWQITPTSQRVVDIEYIGVDQNHKLNGIGRRLIDHIETYTRQLNRHLVRIETASRNLPAQAFYQKLNYTLISTIPNFYNRGNGMLTYVKTL